MKTRYSILFLLCVCMLSTNSVFARKLHQPYVEYINKYGDLAVKHMDKYKIPASITIAQGILESGAGLSDFAKRSNNHFGIKCHSNWKGDRIYRADDSPNDCFRSYRNVEDSYEDHALFLTQRERYASLFKLDIKNYKAWAKGLQSSGYATDKSYANKLIKLIEDYKLYELDKKSKSKGNPQKENSPSVPVYNRTLLKAHGLFYVIAGTNDSYEKIASDMDTKVKDLIKYNDLLEGFPVRSGDIIYLEKKKNKADKPYFEHIVQLGESMHKISQMYGIQLDRLYKLNKKKGDYVPAEGDVLRLR